MSGSLGFTFLSIRSTRERNWVVISQVHVKQIWANVTQIEEYETPTQCVIGIIDFVNLAISNSVAFNLKIDKD